MATTIRWLSHAGFSIKTPGGKTIITDPWITDNPLAPVKSEDIKAADVILVSHDHFDHCANAVDIAKRTGAVVVAQPETSRRLMAEEGLGAENLVNGMGMNIGGTVEVAGIRVTMTEAFHSSATAAPAGYIVHLEDGTTIYHAGDTGIFGSMALLGDIYDIGIALLPIGSCFTMDSYQASKALKLLKPRVAIPMHFRTFPVLEQDASRFVELAGKEAPGVRVVVLEPGQEVTL